MAMNTPSAWIVVLSVYRYYCIMLFEYLESHNISVAELARGTSIPYATVHDLAAGKTKWEKMNAGHFVAMADYLHLTLQEFKNVLTDNPFKNPKYSKELDFFRSVIGHELKRVGAKAFVQSCADGKRIEGHITKKEDPQAVYLVAMVFYLCRVHRLSVPKRVRDYEDCMLSVPLYPESALYLWLAENKNEAALLDIYLGAEPEFRKRNIIEGEIER